jgi:hypothetical protein
MNNTICPHLAIAFTFKCAELKCLGYAQDEIFVKDCEYFNKEITALAVSKRLLHENVRTFFFTDHTSCTYQDGYFKLKSNQIK